MYIYTGYLISWFTKGDQVGPLTDRKAHHNTHKRMNCEAFINILPASN